MLLLTKRGYIPYNIRVDYMEMFTIEFYKEINGECPVEKFLDELDLKTRVKILREIQLLERHGYELREPYSKPLMLGLFELRVKPGSNTSRVLYFFMTERKIVLTNGFIKKQRRHLKMKYLRQYAIEKII